tara:strand:- start:185 stop:559 length:375 start_codon:yes stop_codon:yes gene_type:complete
MTDNNKNEGDIKDGLIEVASKKVLEFINNNMLLEANLMVAQNNLKLQIQSTKDLEMELKGYRENADKTVEASKTEVSDGKKQYSRLKSEFEVLIQERNDLMSKIESGYKPQIKELQAKIKELEK